MKRPVLHRVVEGDGRLEGRLQLALDDRIGRDALLVEQEGREGEEVGVKRSEARPKSEVQQVALDLEAKYAVQRPFERSVFASEEDQRRRTGKEEGGRTRSRASAFRMQHPPLDYPDCWGC